MTGTFFCRDLYGFRSALKLFFDSFDDIGGAKTDSFSVWVMEACQTSFKGVFKALDR